MEFLEKKPTVSRHEDPARAILRSVRSQAGLVEVHAAKVGESVVVIVQESIKVKVVEDVSGVETCEVEVEVPL